jgi:hypothetical protein
MLYHHHRNYHILYWVRYIHRGIIMRYVIREEEEEETRDDDDDDGRVSR